MSKRNLTRLGKAIRQRDAELRSGWEHNYIEAIKAARRGKSARLVDLLRAYRPLSEADFDKLADFVEATTKLGHRQRDAVAYYAAELVEIIERLAPEDYARNPAEIIKSLAPRNQRGSKKAREKAVEIVCEQIAREIEGGVDPEKVWDRLRRPGRMGRPSKSANSRAKSRVAPVRRPKSKRRRS